MTQIDWFVLDLSFGIQHASLESWTCIAVTQFVTRLEVSDLVQNQAILTRLTILLKPPRSIESET